MYDWNAPAHLPDAGRSDGDEDPKPREGDGSEAIDCELEAAIEYKLAVSGFAGIAEIMEVLNRSVRRRWVRGDWT